MTQDTRLGPNALRRPCDPRDIPFEDTSKAEAVPGMVGQDRAAEALRFGSEIRHAGYNPFVAGPPGVGKQSLLAEYLDERAGDQPTPSDWCYAHNFDDSMRPLAFELPPGRGAPFQRDLARAVQELRDALRARFESEEYRTRKQKLADDLNKRQQEELSELQERARRRGVAVLQTPSGLGVAPMRGGSAMSPDQFQALPKSERDERQAEMEAVSAEVQELLRKFYNWGREHEEKLETLNREMASSAAKHALAEVRERYGDLAAVSEHLDRVEGDVVDRAQELLQASTEGREGGLREALAGGREEGPSFDRYLVNLLVDRSGTRGAPVVREDNPTLANLVGRVEREAHFGALTTNFRLIKGGALHRAVGGYLIVDAVKLLSQPFAWDALKRALRAGEVVPETPDQALGLLQVSSMEPRPIPLAGMKLVLTGDRAVYALLSALDPDFPELFKVLVDFEERMDRSRGGEATYANLVASLVAKEGLRAFDREAVARVIDFAARSVGDADKLSVHMRGVVDLLREADHLAAGAERAIAGGEDVDAAIQAQRFRAGRIRERMREAIRREDILIDTSGESVGQVNGLSVVHVGDQAFGQPSRITASARVGKGEVVNIEREVELSGAIHSKGVLILRGVLGSRYAPDRPLSLAASLVFEQSYAPVDGDSASLAELCALLSALSGVPFDQSFAVTGSINQQGRVQSVGGVAEKIEGFFDVCSERGLTGNQGVLIPATNTKNLMLRPDIVRAAAEGQFHVHAVDHVDRAVELLAGRPAGAREEGGDFEPGTVNALVEKRLITFSESARKT